MLLASPKTYSFIYIIYSSVEISLVFLEYFFQAQFAIPKKISEETIMSSAICPPDLSEMHTAHIEIIASDCNVKVFSIITYV